MRSGRLLAIALLATAHTGCAGLMGLGGSRSQLDRYREELAAQHAAALEAQTATPPRTAAERIELADRLRRAGDVERAVWTYLDAYRIEPENPTPRERIAFLYLRDQPERAELILREVLGREPESATAHVGLGLALLAQRDRASATASLERAVELAPESVSALSALAAVYDLSGRHAEAQSLAQRARQLRPGDATIVNNLGVSYLMSGEFARAEGAFRDAISLAPDAAHLFNNLGLALGRQGRYDEALEAFRRFGSEQAALNNLGYVLFLTGRYGEAVARYEQALMLGGEDSARVMRNLRVAQDALREGGPPPARAADR